MFDAVKFAGVSAGEALNATFLPMANEFAEAVQNLGEGGTIAAAFETAAGNIREIFDVDQQGMLQGLLVATMDMSAAARNLAENGKGFWQTLDDVHTWAFRPLSGKGARSSIVSSGARASSTRPCRPSTSETHDRSRIKPRRPRSATR